MRTVAQRKEGEDQPSTGKPKHSPATRWGRKPPHSERKYDQTGPNPNDRPHQHFQRTRGNQAVQRLVTERTRPGIQPKLKVGRPNDRYEREADRVADRVVGDPDPEVEMQPGEGGASGMLQENSPAAGGDPTGAQPAADATSAHVRSGGKFGESLDAGVRREMGAKMGHDFGNVRVYTDDVAVHMNRMLNARAFTNGSDIYFNEDEYNPGTPGGKRLLAHELTHVVQQSQMPGTAAQRELVQRTSIGQILDNFFSPFSSETLWVMGENDRYTRIVRRWSPVIQAVNQVKSNLEANCATWSANHRTDPSWTPGKTDPPVTDPNSFDKWVASPPGTDPETCKNAFIVYVTTKLGESVIGPQIPIPGHPRGVQTFELYTCSIGSFGIYATVDSIDCSGKTAEMNVWMYNAMDEDSFGKFADHPAFSLSGMERQYMWWNWSISHTWGPGGGGGSGSGGGDSDW